MTKLEKNLWAELLLDIIVGFYYFPQIYLLLIGGDEAASGTAMIGLILKTVGLGIVAGLMVNLFVHLTSKPEVRDERDMQFELKGIMAAHWALVILVFALMGQIGAQLFFPMFAERENIVLTPVIIMHLLLVAVILSFSLKSLVRIYYYRRDA